MKNYYLFPFRSILVITIISILASNKLYAGSKNPEGCATQHCYYRGIARIIAGATLTEGKRFQVFDINALNLNNNVQHSVKATNTAISMTLTDFNTISSVGNSWLIFRNSANTLSMDIGTANNTSPQTWTLPANLLTYFNGAGRSDFIAPSSVPVALQIAEANKVMRTPFFDSNNQPMLVYSHFDINSSMINHLGTSYDLEVGEEDNFNEPDYEYSDVPLDLDDSFIITIEDEDYLTNLTLTKFIITSTVDAYGTISTPDGTFNCLRISNVTQQYIRPNELAAYTLAGTNTSVTFVSKEGQYFNAQTSATSGTVNLNDFVYRKVVVTSSLTETIDVKLNNNGNGVSINTSNEIPDPSAILDVRSSNKGILIPRITMANRPANPADGLFIYQLDNGPGLYYFDGSNWLKLQTEGGPAAPNRGKVATNEKYETTQLVNGSTFIKFDSPQENFEDLMINIQLEGDCNGVYISRKNREGFEVKELQKGKSNVKFSYSIQEK